MSVNNLFTVGAPIPGEREKRAEFMRAYVIAYVRSGNYYARPASTRVREAAEEARENWDAIEAEAAK